MYTFFVPLPILPKLRRAASVFIAGPGTSTLSSGGPVVVDVSCSFGGVGLPVVHYRVYAVHVETT